MSEFTFSETFKVLSDGGKRLQKNKYEASGIPVIDQGEEFIGGYCADHTLVQHVDRPVLIFGDHTRRIKYVDFDFIVGADGVKILTPKEFVYPKFAYYYLLATELRDRGYARHFSELKKRTFVIPSLEEQMSVVEILEEQLSRLDAGFLSLEKTKDKLQTHRFALLKAAGTGNLNTKYSALEEYSRSTWKRYTLEELGKWSSGGTPAASNKNYYSGSIPWAVIGDLNESDVYQTAKRITEKALEKSSAKLLPAGTLMLAMYGASIGRTGRMGVAMATNQAIACLQPNEDLVDSDFMLYWLQSNKNDFISAGKGGAQPNISQAIIKSWEIHLPPIQVQKIIVEQLNEQLSSNSRLVDEVSSQLIITSTLRKALLNAAFTGQLTREPANV